MDEFVLAWVPRLAFLGWALDALFWLFSVLLVLDGPPTQTSSLGYLGSCRMLSVGEVPACVVVTFVSWFNAVPYWHLRKVVGLLSFKGQLFFCRGASWCGVLGAVSSLNPHEAGAIP